MKKLFILLTVLLVLGSSCSDFLTVNEKNPNSASAVPANLLLPAALNYTATNITHPDNFTYIYFWYGLMSCSGGYSQPTTLTQYKPTNGSYQNNWYYAYINAQNYDFIIKSVSDPKDMGFKAIGIIMKTYLFQWMVDSYGNVPYSEALKTDEGILKPAYDDQQDIYEDLVLKLDEAIGIINALPVDATEIGDYDIVYGGNMTLWKKFANTLKLRLLMNQSGMTGRSAYITSAIATTAHAAEDYIGVGEGAWANPGYAKSAGKMNPFWENFYKQDDSQQSDGLGYYVAGQDAIDFMTTGNDPRKSRFFAPYNTAGAIQGNYFGAIVLNLPSVTSKLGPGMLQAYNQDAPLMTEWEALFLQAEAVQRGFLTGDAKALYEAAVTESIIYEGGPLGTAANAATYLAQPIANVGWDVSVALKAIITQKWLSLNGLNVMPVWTDYRRTGFPDFLHFTADPATANPTPPVRLLYPQTELNVNEASVLANGTINAFTSKIFWDAN
jgi:hypothetical protein